MSADNWTTCPRCFRRHTAKLAAMRENVNAKYGQIPVAEFDQLRRDLTAAEVEQIPQTLREDYEFHGADDGTVIADYSNSCTKCGLHTKFSYRHEMDLRD